MDSNSIVSSSRNRVLVLSAVGVAPMLFNGFVGALNHPGVTWYWVYEFLFLLVLPVAILIYGIRTQLFSLRDIGLSALLFGERRVLLIVGLGICLTVVEIWLLEPVRIATEDLVAGTFGDTSIFSFLNLIPEQGWTRAIFIWLAAAHAGIFEEILFRGMTHYALNGRSYFNRMYLGLVPALFALVHWENGLHAVASVWLVGVFYAFFYSWFRNLWVVIIPHVALDFWIFLNH